MNFYCQFCSQRCGKMIPSSDWWNCKECQVRYYSCEDGLNIMQFAVWLNNKHYYLQIDMSSNTTKVLDPRLTFFKHHIILETKPAMQNVNPDNVKDKLRTLLMFS